MRKAPRSSIRSSRSISRSGTWTARVSHCSSIQAGSSEASCRTRRWAGRSGQAGPTRSRSTPPGATRRAARLPSHSSGRCAPVREILEPLEPSAWDLSVPASSSRAPLVVRFPWALDRALAERVVGVETADGSAVHGRPEVTDHETTWRFVPRDAWAVGGYRLVALSVLEDPSGNRIGRPFEIDPPPTAVPVPERVTRLFTIR